MSIKNFKSLDEQIELLRSRGLTIDDEDRAKEFLLYNNYYRVSGYSLTLRKNDMFDVSATFQNIMDIYTFDYDLRHIILKYLDAIEVRFKSVFVYEFTKMHGPTGHLLGSWFTDENQHGRIIEKGEKQSRIRHCQEAFIKHFVDDLKQPMPFWVFVDLLTIRDISALYAISENDIKSSVASIFGYTSNQGSKILGDHMRCMTILRNLCAHGNRIYNRLFEQKPLLSRQEKSWLRKNKNGAIDNAHFFSYLLVMRRLLPSDDFADMKRAIIALTEKYPFVRMDYYGFRHDWTSNV